jgi:hypothetical protein
MNWASKLCVRLRGSITFPLDPRKGIRQGPVSSLPLQTAQIQIWISKTALHSMTITASPQGSFVCARVGHRDRRRDISAQRPTVTSIERRNGTARKRTCESSELRICGLSIQNCFCYLLWFVCVLGQRRRAFNNRHKEQIQAIRNNSRNSGYSNHILITGHTYSGLIYPVDIIRTGKKGKHLTA